MQRAIGEHISHHRDRGCGLPRSMSSSVLLCQHCSQHVATAMPCPPSLSPPRCFRLCRGLRPSDALCAGRRDIPVLAWPARPPSPALYMCGCVCVGCCNVPVPVDVFLTFGSAAACCSVASAFVWFGRCVRCRFRLLVWFAAHPPPLATHTPCTPHTPHSPHSHHTQHNPPTPRTLHTHHIHTTPHPLITHNHLHPSHYHRLALAHASLRWHTVILCLWMH